VSFSLDCLTSVGDGIRICRNVGDNSPSDAASLLRRLNSLLMIFSASNSLVKEAVILSVSYARSRDRICSFTK